jgi:hypothetical protein
MQYLALLNKWIEEGDFERVKNGLPEGFLQTRGVCLNYQVLKTIYEQRRGHKLREWRLFCEWVKELPYGELIVGTSISKEL